ncbi:MAG TPA: hypothetical protein VNZ57_01700 [Longimicrobiales bacterium]|nr:hypothetical protein [Longimicrobiales bacterium]
MASACNPIFRRMAMSILVLGFVPELAAQEGGWQADPEVIARWTQQRPQHIWTEEAIPEYTLPDPLRFADGTLVQTPEQWAARRAEILESFRTYVYGRRPGNAAFQRINIVEEDRSAMDGAATLRRIAITSEQDGRSHTFELILFVPNAATGPVPVFLLINNRTADITDPTRAQRSPFWPAEEVIARGYGIAAIQYGELAPDNARRYREGVITLFEGDAAAGERPGDAWMAIAAWGWGASRAMDYFQTDPRVDASRVALIGHSRGGKAALWAGAEDERFALIISNESGEGGAALARRRFGETTAAINNAFPHWFAGNFKAFNDNEDAIPVDQHMLLSLIAPRALYVGSADEDLWADPRGEFLSLVHSSPVYALWGHEAIRPEDMPPLDQPLTVGPRGYHVRRGDHDLTLQDWQYYMDFADRLWGR